MPYKPGFEEDGFLRSLAPFEAKEIELKADNCTKVTGNILDVISCYYDQETKMNIPLREWGFNQGVSRSRVVCTETE